MKRSLFFASLVLLAMTPVHAQDGSEAVRDYFRTYRYTALQPPVAFDPAEVRAKDWLRPGFVFMLDRSNKPRSIGCPSVIQGAPVVSDWIGDSSASLKKKGSLSLAASLLSSFGVINEKASAEAGFSWDTNSLLEFESLRELQPANALTRSELSTLGAGNSATLTGINLDSVCAARIRRHLTEGTPIFLVMSSIEADTIRVRVDESSGYSAKMDFSINKLISVKPGIESKSETSSSASFSMKDRPVRLAILATRIRMARPIGAVSNSNSDRVDITIEAPVFLDNADFSNATLEP